MWELKVDRQSRIKVVANISQTHMVSLDTSRKKGLAFFFMTPLIKQIQMYNYPMYVRSKKIPTINKNSIWRSTWLTSYSLF